jgi:predicted permease
VYQVLLWCYPSAFRREYGGEMLAVFTDQIREARQSGDFRRETAIWAEALTDCFTIAPKEHVHVMNQDVRYALRTLAASPAFAAVAILSLALGIGANSAIFGLLNGIVFSALPVPDPQQLVILTDPSVMGVSVGLENGDRYLLSYAEFEGIRDENDVFTGVMATQSSLDRWQVRINGGEPEDIRGRLVSGGFFQVLGVSAQLGRTFLDADARTPGTAPIAVISYDYWQHRFGGNPGVLGTPLTIRKTIVTVIGVTPPGFFGETVGQRPDLWIPLTMQPGILPGRDWLHDTGPEKVMWLHAFARLRPGVSAAQAQAGANAVFKNGIERHYGTLPMSPEARRDFTRQSLQVRPASTGASTVRGGFSEQLQMLLAAVGLVLLIACANLANLLLARGAVRQREIALRLTLGANRGRLVRQMLTESLVLSAGGAVAGLAVAYAVHRGLVGLVVGGVDSFVMGFDLDWRVLLFGVAVTLAATLFFGLLPALLTTQAQPGENLKGHGCSATSTSGQIRWGRVLVAAQLALSLPLLVGAGQLLQTLRNLRQADLGYPSERLLTVQVDAQSAGYEKERRAPLFQELLQNIRRIPGVRAASFSENGLFSGRDSGDAVIVEGFTPKNDGDRGANWDQLGPGYFSTLGVPMLLGREFNDNDTAGSLKVCVINESFAKKFFAGRNPIGMHITSVFGDSRKTYEVVGVAKNVRARRIRGDVEPRYYAPITQPLGEFDGVTFEIRTAGEPGAVIAAARRVVRNRDESLPIVATRTVDQRLAERMWQDKMMAQLAVAFGLVAMALVAVGLYGVLSYGVARRRTEIGVRMALGAQPRQVVAMMLRETGTLLLAGVVVGAGLAWAAALAIKSRLYGLVPQDSATFAAALAVLLFVALVATWLPARRASLADPMAALRQD